MVRQVCGKTNTQVLAEILVWHEHMCGKNNGLHLHGKTNVHVMSKKKTNADVMPKKKMNMKLQYLNLSTYLGDEDQL
jgi:hypothetical protein